MRLSSAQQQALRDKHGICVNEVCDKCSRPLGHIRYTRKDQAGEWCSRECRDGAEAAARYRATRKLTKARKCWYCGLTLPSDVRENSKYCDRTCEQKAYKARKAA
jgi:hypothetical protein